MKNDIISHPFILLKGLSLFVLVILSLLWGCERNSKSQSRDTLSGNLVIFHAGSLSVPFKEIADSFETRYPDINVQREVSGSVECARKIRDLKRECDIMASADYKVIDQFLIPEYTDWLVRFAANEMALIYQKSSKYNGEINKSNWFNIIQRDDVLYGRSDPDSDPCGYRTVLSLRLAEKYYERPGMADRILSKDNKYMRPKETDLLALLESDVIDYIFLYRSVAEQHGFEYLMLPDSINLGKPELREWYNTVSVDIAGKRPGKNISVQGESMIYGVTMLENAPNPEIAHAFLHFLLSEDSGMKIIEKNGQETLVPASTRYYKNLPEEFRQYTRQ
ncbi:MAG: tungstate ABC transporter substrate-binding protein WtpA [Bacteroidales bacterium]